MRDGSTKLQQPGEGQLLTSCFLSNFVIIDKCFQASVLLVERSSLSSLLIQAVTQNSLNVDPLRFSQVDVVCLIFSFRKYLLGRNEWDNSNVTDASLIQLSYFVRQSSGLTSSKEEWWKNYKVIDKREVWDLSEC